MCRNGIDRGQSCYFSIRARRMIEWGVLPWTSKSNMMLFNFDLCWKGFFYDVLHTEQYIKKVFYTPSDSYIYKNLVTIISRCNLFPFLFFFESIVLPAWICFFFLANVGYQSSVTFKDIKSIWDQYFSIR